MTASAAREAQQCRHFDASGQNPLELASVSLQSRGANFDLADPFFAPPPRAHRASASLPDCMHHKQCSYQTATIKFVLCDPKVRSTTARRAKVPPQTPVSLRLPATKPICARGYCAHSA